MKHVGNVYGKYCFSILKLGVNNHYIFHLDRTPMDFLRNSKEFLGNSAWKNMRNRKMPLKKMKILDRLENSSQGKTMEISIGIP